MLKNSIAIPLILLLTACAGQSARIAIENSQVAAAPDYQWPHSLGGDALAHLVAEAWRTNPRLDAAMAAVEKARAQAVITGAVRSPQIGLGVEAGRSRASSGSGHSIGNSYGLFGDISWVPDLWGRVAARKRASRADIGASQADLNGVKLLLAGEVARAWFGVQESILQWQLGQRRSDNFAATLAVIEERYRAGLQEALDVYLAKENLATARATELAAQQRADASARVLEALLGRFPAANAIEVDRMNALPGSIPAGIDARVLLRRPDLQAWQQRLVAAEALAAEAAKNRLPAISLTARGGTQSQRLADLLDWDNLVWSLFGNLAQPLFQGGRLKAEQLLANATAREVKANYARAVLVALREVHTALAAEPLLEARVVRQREAVIAATRAAELSLANYRAGLIDIDVLLTSQRRAFAAEATLLTVELDRLLNRVDLYLAIGGDFPSELENTAEASD